MAAPLEMLAGVVANVREHGTMESSRSPMSSDATTTTTTTITTATTSATVEPARSLGVNQAKVKPSAPPPLKRHKSHKSHKSRKSHNAVQSTAVPRRTVRDQNRRNDSVQSAALTSHPTTSQPNDQQHLPQRLEASRLSSEKQQHQQQSYECPAEDTIRPSYHPQHVHPNQTEILCQNQQAQVMQYQQAQLARLSESHHTTSPNIIGNPPNMPIAPHSSSPQHLAPVSTAVHHHFPHNYALAAMQLQEPGHTLPHHIRSTCESPCNQYDEQKSLPNDGLVQEQSSLHNLRSLSSPNSSRPSSSRMVDTASQETDKDPDKDDNDKRALRAERNRQSAAASRERKKRHVKDLESRVHYLSDMTAALQHRAHVDKQEWLAKEQSWREENDKLRSQLADALTRHGCKSSPKLSPLACTSASSPTKHVCRQLVHPQPSHSSQIPATSDVHAHSQQQYTMGQTHCQPQQLPQLHHAIHPSDSTVSCHTYIPRQEGAASQQVMQPPTTFAQPLASVEHTSASESRSPLPRQVTLPRPDNLPHYHQAQNFPQYSHQLPSVPSTSMHIGSHKSL